MQVHQMGYLTDMLGSRAVDVVNGYAKSGRPFLMSLHFNAPHWPWEAPGDEAESNRLRSASSLRDFDGGTQKTYQRMIQEMDLQIGRVLEALNAHGLAENTIVIFTSDNGGERFADTWPFTGRKTELLEGGLRIPAIVSWPARIPQGRTIHQVAISMDWMPTLLAAAGVSSDPAFPPDGVNLLPMLTQNAAAVERRLFWRYKANAQRAARDGDYQVFEDPRQHVSLQCGGGPDGARQPQRRGARMFTTGWRRSGTNGTRPCCRKIDASSTDNFSGDELADHIGTQKTSGKADNPVPPKAASAKPR